MRHVAVYRSEDTFAGWPANHGHWQRGNELLVGFMRGPFGDGNGYHRISEPFEKVQARSLDAGETWVVEAPGVDFNAETVEYPPPKFSLETHIIRVCGMYDTGGETCDGEGGLYLSRDFGHEWAGPYYFDGVVSQHFSLPLGAKGPIPYNTSRTAYLQNRGLIFLSRALRGFDDAVFCAAVEDGKFRFLSWVCNDDHRAVMPDVAEMGGAIYVALRRRGPKTECWIDLFKSWDAIQWNFAGRVASTGGWNGNPPALVAHEGELVCAYANRTKKQMLLARSRDHGETWHEEPVRHGEVQDIGYPRLFSCGERLVCVYYWSESGEPQHIEATILE